MAHENSQFETDRRLKHPWNSGVVAADVRLTAGKLLLDQSMLAGEPVPQRSRVDPAILVLSICRRLGPGRSCWGDRPLFLKLPLLIAATTENQRVLASGRNLEVIPVTLGVSSWKVSRQRLRPASSSSLPISRISTRQRHCRLVKPAGDEDLTL